MLLIYHFFCVALYSIYILFTNPVLQPYSRSSVSSSSSSTADLIELETPSISDLSSESDVEELTEFKATGDVLSPPSYAQYPALTVKSVKVFWTALVVLAPVLWNEGQM